MDFLQSYIEVEFFLWVLQKVENLLGNDEQSEVLLQIKKIFQKSVIFSTFCIKLFGSVLWHYELWGFQMGGIKLERYLPKNQHTQTQFLNFENLTNGSL